VGLLAPERSVDTERSTVRLATLALGFALLTLNLLDLLLTDLSISRFGGSEINPVMAPIVGTHLATAAKIGIPLVVMALATRVRSWRTVIFLRIAVAVYLLVAVLTLAQVALVLN
jgi:hypothetical protein